MRVVVNDDGDRGGERVRRRVAGGFVALSLLLAVATGVLWLKHALRGEFHFGRPPGIVGRANDVTPAFPRFKLIGRDGFEWTTFHPRETRYGPVYLTPEYMQWEKQFRRRDRVLTFLGFRYAYWAVISYHGAADRQAYTWFSGYEREVVVPYWFALALFVLPPLLWLRAHRRRRQWQRAEGCPTCGYDLRATPGRCPECGATG